MKPKHPETNGASGASERGSRPWSELDELVDDAVYRLRIDGEVYAQVDKLALIELIERGALMGHEEIAEMDGPWMAVREHPVLARIRAMMARELHALFGEFDIAPSPSTLGAGSARYSEPSEKLPHTRLDLVAVLEKAIIGAVILSLSVLFALFALIISRAYF